MSNLSDLVEVCEHGIMYYLRCEECLAKKETCWHGVKMDAFCSQCATIHPTNRKPLQAGEVKPVQIDSTIFGYEELARILERAFDQSAHGKGKQRHANNKPFTEQPIMQIARMVGLGGHAYQIMKKTQEATNMNKRGEHDAAIAEFRGAIIYAAAAILLIEEQKDA